MFDPGQTLTAADAIAAVRDADAASARAVMAIAAVGCARIAREHAMPSEVALSWGSGKQRSEVAQLIGMAQVLRTMPITWGLFCRGTISFGQARGIWLSARSLDTSQRRELDDYLGERAANLHNAEPEALVHAAEDRSFALAHRAQERREQRAIEGTYLVVQPDLAGGARVHGAFDAASGATIVAGLDAIAGPPEGPGLDPADDPDGDVSHAATMARARQYGRAMVQVFEDVLAGSSHAERAAPRPRFIATCDINELIGMGASEGARVLWGLVGGPGRLSPLATEVAACDSEVAVVAFAGARPVAVTNPRASVPDKVRTAVIARDGGCRFCGAAAAWSEIHHINARAGHHLANLVLLCRRCHRRMHRRAWRIEVGDDDLVRFTHRGRTIATAPRARPLRL